LKVWKDKKKSGVMIMNNFNQRRSLLVTNDYPPVVSGIGTVFYNLFRFQNKEKFFILCPWEARGEEFDRKEGMSVIRVKIPTGESVFAKVSKTLLNLVAIFFYVHKLKIGKLHCGQILSNGIAGLLVKIIFRIPYIVWVYGSETIRFGESKLLVFLMQRILSAAELIVANSSFTEDEYLRFGVDRKRLMVITPGVDTSFFVPALKSEELVRKFTLQGKQVLCTIARLDERKGHDMVIKAMSVLRKEFPDLVYLIVGRGREKERLRRIATAENVGDVVFFAGYVADEELPDYYNLGDIFILPNRETRNTALKGDYEGFGTVFLEANACGKPVIGGRSGGVGDAIEEQVTGMLVDPDSLDDIVETVRDLLINNDKMRTMGEAGRSRAVERFDWKILATNLNKIL